MAHDTNELLERFLLQMAELGGRVSHAISEATQQPEFVGNAPLLVLCMLDLEGPSRPGELQEVVGLTSGGTSKLLDRMQEAGLIARSYGVIVDDNRGVQVSITAKGRRHVRRATGALADHLPETTVLVKDIVALVEAIEFKR